MKNITISISGIVGDEVNYNNRIYPLDVIEKAIEKAKAKTVYLTIGNNKDSIVGKVEGYSLIDKRIAIDVRILDTPCAKLLGSIQQPKYYISCSTSSIKHNTNKIESFNINQVLILV